MVKKIVIQSVFAFFILVMSSNASQAQETKKDNIPLVTATLYCPDNPECIYSGHNDIPVYKKIINHSDQNLQIPLEAIKDFWTWTYLTDKKTGKPVGKPPHVGMYVPDFTKILQRLPAHGEITYPVGTYNKAFLKDAFHEADSSHLILKEEIDTPVYYEGSKEAIGSYNKDGKFEEKNFKLISEITITKK